MMVLFSFYVGNFGSYNETHVYQSLFGKGEVEPIGVLWHTRRTCLRALSPVGTLRKPKKLARKNGSREVVRRVKGAHSAPPSPTLLLTKQALRERCEYVGFTTGLWVSSSTMCRAIARLGSTRRKGGASSHPARRFLEGGLVGDGQSE